MHGSLNVQMGKGDLGDEPMGVVVVVVVVVVCAA